MTPYFDSKCANASEIHDRLQQLKQAIEAIQDQRTPAMQAIIEQCNCDLRAFDAANPDAENHPDRLAIIAKSDEILLSLLREAVSYRAPLDRLIEFYTGRDVDHQNIILH